MENLDPFWWTVGLISVWSAGFGLVLTLIASVVWLLRRSKFTLMVFLVVLTGTAMAGMTFVVSLLLMERR